MLKPSKHFIRNWQKRVDDNPDPVRVNKIIQRAVRIQKGKRARTRFSFIKTLSIFWHADMDLIITVDAFTNTIVSVYSRLNMPSDNNLGTLQEGLN